ncbi:hypothetical protein MHYP_G00283280 [Metynnis hypsauchen]
MVLKMQSSWVLLFKIMANGNSTHQSCFTTAAPTDDRSPANSRPRGNLKETTATSRKFRPNRNIQHGNDTEKRSKIAMETIAHWILFEEFFCDLYLSVGDMLAHVVVEVLDLVELDRAHRAHVGGPFLAARFCSHSHSTCHTHSCTTDSAPGPTSSNRHGQSHHAWPRLRHRHGNRDGGRASGTSSACHPSHSSHPGDSGDPSDPGDPGSSAVQGHVALQQGLVGELLLADVALVGLLAAVQPHVDVERALLGEALVADAALVGADACVRDHVFDKSED